MKELTADTVRKHHFRRYRLRRFGAAGAQGNGGIARAAAFHGIRVRAWMYYESGDRRPKLRLRQAVARWLNRLNREPVTIEPLSDTAAYGSTTTTLTFVGKRK